MHQLLYQPTIWVPPLMSRGFAGIDAKRNDYKEEDENGSISILL
jgi:hypothetical protein